MRNKVSLASHLKYDLRFKFCANEAAVSEWNDCLTSEP